jgi:hypothetical protein
MARRNWQKVADDEFEDMNRAYPDNDWGELRDRVR